MLGYLPNWAEYLVIVLAVMTHVAWDTTDKLSAFSKSRKDFTVTCTCSESSKWHLFDYPREERENLCGKTVICWWL